MTIFFRRANRGMNSSHAWLVWMLGAACFFSEYIARVSPSVMVPELMRDFQVNALALGSLSAFFYYAYLGMQIPVGVLVDRYGVRRLLSANTLLFAMGCCVFALSKSVEGASLGRFIMGFGASFAFVSALKLATVWFSPTRFGLLAGLTQALGMLGASFGQAPASYMVDTVGWRKTLLIMSILFAVLACLVWLIVRDRPEGSSLPSEEQEHQVGLLTGLGIVLRNRESWMNAIFAGLLYAPTTTIAELWGVSFLERAFGFSKEVAATGIGLIFVGWAIGGPITGWISDHIGRRRPILIASVIFSCVFLLPVLYAPHLSKTALFLLLFAYGVANTGLGTSYALASELNPHKVAGTSMAFANMASVLLGASFQPIVGWLLDKQWGGLYEISGVRLYTAHDFRMAFLVLPISLLVGCFIALRVRETHCKTYEQ